MIDTRTLIMLAEYNAWADDTLFAAAAELPGDSVYKEKKTLFKNVVGTLNHNYQVDLIWQGNLEGKPHGFTSRRDLLHPRLEDLIDAQRASNRWYVDWAKRQDDASIAEVLPFTYTSGAECKMSRAAMFLHVINHKTFHRGWVSEMFFDLGSRPPQTDISVYLTEGHAEVTPSGWSSDRGRQIDRPIEDAVSEVASYFESVPVARREMLDALHALIMRLYPAATVDLRYKMPTYHAADGWVAIANQKNYVSLYTCSAHHLVEFKKQHPKVQTGKGCINFKPSDRLPLRDIETVVRHAIDHPKPT